MGGLHRQRHRRGAAQALTLAAVALLGLLSGCSGGSSPAPPTGPRPAPDLAAFLRLPVASPSSCPADANGETVGRRSPWVGTVDVSVFVADHTPAREVTALRRHLAALPHVRHVYFESQAQAYAEFQRLYTCSEQVPATSVPASYRLVLYAVTRSERDDLVRRVYDLAGVASVSCDPSSPCVDLRPSGS